MHLAVVVKVHETVERIVSFLERRELVNAKQLKLEYAMKRLNVSIHIRGSWRDPFVDHLPALAHVPEQLADELRAVVRTDDGHRFAWLNAVLQGDSQRLYGVFGLANRASVLPDDDAVEYVDDAEYEKEASLPGRIAVFNIHLPELIRCGDGAISRQSPRMRLQALPRVLKNAKLLAQSMSLFLIQYHAMLVANTAREQLIAVDVLFALEQREQPFLDLLVADFLA